jgi:hypothetical protein
MPGQPVTASTRFVLALAVVLVFMHPGYIRYL